MSQTKFSLLDFIFESKTSMIACYLIAFFDFSIIADVSKLGDFGQFLKFCLLIIKFFGLYIASGELKRKRNDSHFKSYFYQFYLNPPISVVFMLFMLLVGFLYISVFEDGVIWQFFYNVVVVISVFFFNYFQKRDDKFLVLLDEFEKLSNSSKS